jgi:hypothetical protein
MVIVERTMCFVDVIFFLHISLAMFSVTNDTPKVNKIIITQIGLVRSSQEKFFVSF